MSAVWLHLTLVHVPVVGCALVALLLAVALNRRSDLLLYTSAALLVLLAVAAVGAYLSGTAALEALTQELDEQRDRVESHGLLGRGAFAGMILLGALASQILLRAGSGEETAAWAPWSLLLGALVMAVLLAWTAHLGGQVGHPELRQSMSSNIPGEVLVPTRQD
jgi:hypothetical protein